MKLMTDLQERFDEVLENGLRVEQFHGYLTAVICAPEMVRPSDWLSIALPPDVDEKAFGSIEEANEYLRLLMEFSNSIAKGLQDGTFEPLFTLTSKKVTPEIAQVWCKGFVQGLTLWNRSFTKDEVARSFVLPMLVLAEMGMVLKSIKDADKANITDNEIEEYKKTSLELVKENVLALREYHLNKPVVRKNVVGRNDPCPCGSGKKYKKCCGQ
jgi:yecA family protein